MGFGSVWHWVVVLVIVLVLFGRGRVADVMGEFGKGLKSFKQGMSEGSEVEPKAPASQIPPPSGSATLNGEEIVDPSQNKPQ